MVRPTVVLATKNRGKVTEFLALLPGDIEIKTLDDMNMSAPPETGVTFAENAAIKALGISALCDAIVIADDSGLEVDVLSGAPGVWSARFAGEPPDDERNIELLLEKLQGIPDKDRTARFVCSVIVSRGDQILLESMGYCDGVIGHERRGTNGFGYDPLFILPNGRTMAELSPDQKNALSHRAHAFRQVAEPLYELVTSNPRRS